MWTEGWRDRIWSQLNEEWDLIIIGGGITGAGVLREAVARGLKTLLVEARDFSFGTSSRSSKLVHGGIRYLRNKQYNVTRESVQEREWMLKEARGLVTPLGFMMPNLASSGTPNWKLHLGVMIYDYFGRKWAHRAYSRAGFLRANPEINPDQLVGGFLYYDARMDDSRLVLRVIREAVAAGGTAINDARVVDLLRNQSGAVCGVVLRDEAAPEKCCAEVRARVVINASGPWSDELRQKVGAPARLRKLRGSHLVFERSRLPLQQAVTILHPKDNRAMFAIPWEGTLLIGTTDLDHPREWDDREPFATGEEIAYILEAANHVFPGVHLAESDIVSTFSGLRPVVNTGKAHPSQESRAHVVWEEAGLLTITGGKLTTFRLMAKEVLQKAASRLPGTPDFTPRVRIFDPLPAIETARAAGLSPADLLYLQGRYGADTADLLAAAAPGELESIAGLPNRWVELRWAARAEGVQHLDDLLLRRVRLGLLLPQGGLGELARIRAMVQPELGWDDARWDAEEAAYRRIWQQSYSPAPTGVNAG
ncbi:MAG TPA: glycerol-3-phosphate dehydrogenase/oxidase [Anaerolineaceae bacterium]|nr:glycerol-3-phosphate dehydrogenase/oxidase [Anaerolineaceae bacterium]HPN51540.1 glycerol-3-phosphate dehydrogenase/oxidase [Anaerolineaceae bacterium]